MKEKIFFHPHIVKQLNEKIDVIAKHLNTSSNTSLNLMEGKTGEILFWAYYSKYKKDVAAKNKITSLLSDVFDEIKNGFKDPTFCCGLSGIGWTVEHLAQNGFIKADTNKVIGSLDDFLYPYLLFYIRAGNYDYLHGALGIGLYYTNRSTNSKFQEYLIEMVNELEKQSTRMNQGIAWNVKLAPDSDIRGYNISMSHGISSIIGILSRLYKIGICKEKVSELVTGAVNYLLQNKQETTSQYLFPRWVCETENETKKSGRLAWCYYDMGIAIALWQAGLLFNNEKWKNEAIDTLLHTTIITDIKESGACDAGLCHGTVGIAHIYHRMYSYTNIDAFKKSAIFWFEQSLKMASFEDGLAGYKAYRGDWVNDYGLLDGISGIGLAMISAVSDIEPKWDGALLLS